MSNKQQTEIHPSYGAISIGRVSSSEAHAMYGSSVKHRETIRLTLHHGERKRMLSGDWYSAGATIAEVEMTQNQWAELVSSVGMGSGVPCTIKWLNGPVEPCPFVDKKEQFQEEFNDEVQKAMTAATEAIEEINRLMDQKTVKKSDLRAMQDQFTQIRNTLNSNLAFLSKQFATQMEKTAVEVKGEIEGWQLARMHELAALGAAMQLSGKDEAALNALLPHIDLSDKPDNGPAAKEDQEAEDK